MKTAGPCIVNEFITLPIYFSMKKKCFVSIRCLIVLYTACKFIENLSQMQLQAKTRSWKCGETRILVWLWAVIKATYMCITYTRRHVYTRNKIESFIWGRTERSHFVDALNQKIENRSKNRKSKEKTHSIQSNYFQLFIFKYRKFCQKIHMEIFSLKISSYGSVPTNLDSRKHEILDLHLAPSLGWAVQAAIQTGITSILKWWKLTAELHWLDSLIRL